MKENQNHYWKNRTKPSNKHSTCAVAECDNPKGIAYHEFPKNEQCRKIWIQRCRRDDKKGKPLNPNTARICESHFTRNDYKPNMKRKILKEGAVPSVFAGRNMPQHTEVFSNDLLEKILKKLPPVSPVAATTPDETPTLTKNPCVVPGCKRPLNVTLHVFPPEPQESIWLERLQMDNLLMANGKKRKNPKVCGCHFVKEDIEEKTSSNGSIIRRLKKGAVPSRNIQLDTSLPLYPQPPQLPEEEILIPQNNEGVVANEATVTEELFFESARDERHHNRSDTIAKEALIGEEKKAEEDKSAPREAGTQYSPIKEARPAPPDPKDEEIKKLKKLMKAQKRQLQHKDRKIKRLEHKAQHPNKAVFQKEMVQFLTQQGIPKSQIQCLVYKKKYTWYRNDPEGLARAAVQFAISPNLYNHIQKLHGALKVPHRTTLAEHYKHFQVTKGFQTDGINILEKMRQTTDKKFYEHALIAFDEVAIKGDEVEMDKRTQEVLGPHSKMQVVSIRGLGPK